jgi:hypothetical protein
VDVRIVRWSRRAGCAPFRTWMKKTFSALSANRRHALCARGKQIPPTGKAF